MQERVGVVSAAVLLSITLASCGRFSRSGSDSERRRADVPPVERSADIQSYAHVVDQAENSVVTIRSSRRVRQPRQYPFHNDPFFDFFGRGFGGSPQPGERLYEGLGSGVIVGGDGTVVTNHHVIDGAQDIRVEFVGGRTYDAKIIGSDPPSDLAVLKIPASNLQPIALGNSDDVRVGDVVLAIGNPLGVGRTVTAGIISAKGRTTGLSDGSFEDFLQTDAPINQGNSGGALVNTAGQLVGINSQILSPTGVNIGIGFAIPVNMMRDVLDQLVERGRVRRGQLGVVVQPITTDLAEAMNLKERQGVLVSAVEPGSAADRAGIRRGDVITSVNGQQVQTPNELRNLVSSRNPGTQVKITLQREGKTVELNATLAELEMEPRADRRGSPENGDTQTTLGIAAQPLTPAIARELGIPAATGGIVVQNVDPAGAAAEAGVRRGDVIVQANRKPVRSAQDLEQIVSAGGSGAVVLLLNRRGRTFFIPVRPR